MAIILSMITFGVGKHALTQYQVIKLKYENYDNKE